MMNKGWMSKEYCEGCLQLYLEANQKLSQRSTSSVTHPTTLDSRNRRVQVSLYKRVLIANGLKRIEEAYFNCGCARQI